MTTLQLTKVAEPYEFCVDLIINDHITYSRIENEDYRPNGVHLEY